MSLCISLYYSPLKILPHYHHRCHQCDRAEPPFVQVMHVSGNHWVTVVAITDSLVKVYDSLYKCSNTCVTSQSAAILNSASEHIVFQNEKVQYQKGTTDCGLYAIAFATEYCHGNNPECFRYI